MSGVKTSVPILRVENLCKHFGKRSILDNLNFEIYKGEVLSILGLSGCGKSTLLNVLCGFLKQSSGRIVSLEESNKRKFFERFRSSERIRNLFGFASQEPSFYPHLTVYDNLKYFGVMCSVPRRELEERIDVILHMLNLEDVRGTIAMSLSEGMKKRLDFGCSIIHFPKILILDEPTANLDFKLREEMLRYVKEINTLGITIIFVSHYLEEIFEISDRVGIISNCYIDLVPNDERLKRQYAAKLQVK